MCQNETLISWNESKFMNYLPGITTYYNQNPLIILTSKTRDEERTDYATLLAFFFPSLFGGVATFSLIILDKTSACFVLPS